jgi:hypothetical protein
MKTRVRIPVNWKILATAALALLIQAKSTGLAQSLCFGQVVVNNRVLPDIYAPISMEDGDPPPPGAQAQLMRVADDGTLIPIFPLLSFRTGISNPGYPAVGYFLSGITPCVGVQPGQQATFRIRAWMGADWDSADFRGESSDVTVAVGGGLIVPPNLPLEPFTLWRHFIVTLSANDGSVTVGLDTPEPSTHQGAVLQTSTDLLNWKDMVTNSEPSSSISFDVLANEDARFYRVIRR